MDVKDAQVPVPWGHVAVKLWGDEKNRAVLVCHGILDNAGSFDRLIPLLPNNFFYICIDLPGHGRSSHMPATAFLNTSDYLFVFRAVMDFYARESYIILGHSYGGQLGIFFTHLYPERITQVILLDTIFVYPTPPGNLKFTIRNIHDSYISTMAKLAKNNPPEYTYEQAITKLTSHGRYGEITVEAAKPLLNRMMIPQANGKLRLSIDQRLKFYLNPLMDFRYICEFIKKHPINFPVLIILAKASEILNIYFPNVVQQLATNKNFRLMVVDGEHDVHNNEPETVAPFINKFLLSGGEKSKL